MEKMKISITAPSIPKNIPGIGYKKLRDRGIIVLNLKSIRNYEYLEVNLMDYNHMERYSGL